MFYKYFGKKSSCGADTHADKSTIKSEIISNPQLTEELDKPITRKVEKWKAYSTFKGNIQGYDEAVMQLTNK